jgi:hypothetical protein
MALFHRGVRAFASDLVIGVIFFSHILQRKVKFPSDRREIVKGQLSCLSINTL